MQFLRSPLCFFLLAEEKSTGPKNGDGTTVDATCSWSKDCLLDSVVVVLLLMSLVEVV